MRLQYQEKITTLLFFHGKDDQKKQFSLYNINLIIKTSIRLT